MDPKSNQFNLALTFFLVPYVLLEIPSNIILKKLRPLIWLAGCMFCFGVWTIGQGLVTNYGGLLAMRFLIGMAESGMSPGCTCFYLIGMWYRRSDVLCRYTYFFNSTRLAGAFGGLIAYGCCLTCAIVIVAFFAIADFPEQTKWLTAHERRWIKERLGADHTSDDSAAQPVHVSDILEILKGYKISLGALLYFSFLVPAYSYAYFSPTIIESYGYTHIETQLHSIPPLAMAFFLSLGIAFRSYRLRHRYLFVLTCLTIAMAGIAVLLNVHPSRDVKYGALFLVVLAPYCGMPVAICWFTMNLGGYRRRAIGTALQLGFGEIAGIVATFLFLAKDAPYYHTGFSVAVSFLALAAFWASCYFLACWMQNRNRDRPAISDI